MNTNPNNKKLIEDYFEGNLSASEKADLEHMLEVDPGLKSEFDLQQTIIESIQETRMAELKSYLNNIQVGWHHLIPNSWKVAANVTLLSATSLSAYFLLENNSLPDISTIDLSLGTSIEQIVDEKTSLPDLPEAEVSEEIIVEETNIVEEEIKEAEEPTIIAENEIETTPQYEPMVVVPDMPDDFEEISNPDPMPDVAEELPVFEPVAGSSSALDMATIPDSKHQFHYTLSEGKLALYGSFKDSPYEIMELKSTSSTKMFLFYKNNYYNLRKNTTKVSPLEPVTDNTLITELDVLRQNK